MISQLFYDIAVPFDTGAGKKQKRSGYDPRQHGGGEMWKETRQWLLDHRLSVDEFRRLDDAPLKYWESHRSPDVDLGTACSRVLDKLFYG